MSTSDPPPPPPRRSADEMARQLRSSLRSERPQTTRVIIVLLLGSILALAGLAWWLYPGEDPPALAVMAFDTIAPEGAATQVQARLFVADGPETRARLGDHTVVFVENRLILAPGETPREVKATTDAAGRAQTDWPVPAAPKPAEFQARYLDPRSRQSSQSGGRVFVWPKDSTLLLVDVSATLVQDPPESWDKAEVARIAMQAGAAAALGRISRDGVRVGYLLMDPPRWQDHLRLRSWVEAQQQAAAGLPVGPVLSGHAVADEASADAARAALLNNLKQQFTGKLLAVAGAGSSPVLRDLGIDTVELDEGKGQALVWPAAAEAVVKRAGQRR